MAEKEHWTEDSVADAIQKTRHADTQAWVCVRGVPDATSVNKNRTADLMAMGCWKSVGIALHGYEIKVSRSDWLREMQDISKAAAFTGFCHYWWIAAPAGIVKIEEMPLNWGLIEVAKKDGKYSAKTRKVVTKNESASLTFNFFAACLRQCRSTDPVENKLKELLSTEYHRGLDEGRKRHNQDARIKTLEEHCRELQTRIHKFEQASGVHIDRYGNPERIGEAVKHVLKVGKTSIASCGQLKFMLDEIRVTIDQFEKAAKIADEVNPDDSVSILTPASA